MPRHKPRSRARAAAAGGGGGALLLIALILVGGGIPDSDSSAPVDTCDDGIDNDGDGFVDAIDPECDPLSPGYDGVEDGDA